MKPTSEPTARYPATIRVRAPGELVDAVQVAANRAMTTPSEFTRQALLTKLRAEGVDPVPPSKAA